MVENDTINREKTGCADVVEGGGDHHMLTTSALMKYDGVPDAGDGENGAGGEGRRDMWERCCRCCGEKTGERQEWKYESHCVSCVCVCCGCVVHLDSYRRYLVRRRGIKCLVQL